MTFPAFDGGSQRSDIIAAEAQQRQAESAVTNYVEGPASLQLSA